MPLIRNFTRCIVFLSLAVGVGRAQWVQTNAPTNLSYRNLFSNGSHLFSSALGNGVYRTADNGVNWSRVNGGPMDSANNVYSFAAFGADLFAGTSNGVFHSSNSGTTWSLPSNYGLSDPWTYALIAHANHLFAGTNGGGVFRSSDYGVNWITVNNGMVADNGLPLNGPRNFGAIGPHLFAGGVTFPSGLGVCRTSDNGANWSSVGGGLPGGAVGPFVALGTIFFAATNIVNSPLFRSSDSGANWIRLNVNSIVDLAASSPCLFGAIGSGIQVTSDSGTTWIPIDNGLPCCSVWSITVHAANLFAASGLGIWRRPLSEMIPVSFRVSNPSPAKFGLNFGNPIRPGTGIEFGVRQRAPINLAAYHASGEKAATLVNSVLAPGNYQADFDATGLSSGLYFLRLQADGVSRTKRVVFER